MTALEKMRLLGACAETEETPEALLRHARRSEDNKERINLSERHQKLNVLFAVQQAC